MGGSELEVLKGIDMELRGGEVTAVVGKSGVGKSTLLHILGALDRPTQGSVKVNGENIFRFNDEELAYFRNHKVGFVFQFHHLMPEFTALENTMMPAIIAGQNETEAKLRAYKLLDDVELSNRTDHRPGELSGGELQRVAVARALMNDPQIILADEPTGNLDTVISNRLHELLFRLMTSPERAFVIVTHDRGLAEKADRIIKLEDGKISMDISKESMVPVDGLFS